MCRKDAVDNKEYCGAEKQAMNVGSAMARNIFNNINCGMGYKDE